MRGRVRLETRPRQMGASQRRDRSARSAICTLKNQLQISIFNSKINKLKINYNRSGAICGLERGSLESSGFGSPQPEKNFCFMRIRLQRWLERPVSRTPLFACVRRLPRYPLGRAHAIFFLGVRPKTQCRFQGSGSREVCDCR